ncbi:hypothetical protein R1sor_011112 [Riccia sorocarpa]|uniref:Uncharacterized protein n=1 Tax=Riccia sorocarpa TaxID=122646 RepID=A0ABD3I1C3_9MARC
MAERYDSSPFHTDDEVHPFSDLVVRAQAAINKTNGGSFCDTVSNSLTLTRGLCSMEDFSIVQVSVM